MAYGPQENETEEEKEARFVRERARKEIRKQQRAAKKQEKDQLKQASGTKARRRIKEQFDKIDEGIESGGIYDVDTNTYTPPKPHPDTGKRNLLDDAVDFIPRDPSGDDDSITFNGSVLICIDGKPFYIDIPYDPTTGVYSESNGANFPITAP
tara:strand:+ start:1068 stop:1526 length:459 start_codon:yes stop_codon:yes gene_type:complete